jgi:hypothetical protein
MADRLMIVGEGPERGQPEAKIREHNLETCIELWAGKPRKKWVS